ncbi:hypothetical protein [Sphaerochaeta globosa]|uniref:Uncharacterized protein n=1 Tax=Sphaerochaeta globosa (strain ATCC BAA-1886 / DSM 22777 / Buddy) TaxID=158189 RepID=F0RY71_SPHGB|nr:hypothetical protein [Sphaerochaeta globosa]ADY12570.1 hypothetical protein SpiBuddy_0743 [Sphaerochaeta globosa str. Buddy]
MEKDTRTLLVLKIGQGAFRAKDLANEAIVSVKSPQAYDIAECDTVTFEVTKQWQFKKTIYLSGPLLEHHFDLGSLDIDGHEFMEVELVSATEWYAPNELKGFIAECLRGGKRMSYAFEDYTGYGFYQKDCDPVTEANESDTIDQKYDKHAKLWEDYPQCIDALVHMGYVNFQYSRSLRNAENCLRSAIHIAEKHFMPNLDGIFLWSELNNRPYLRALHGLCLVEWRKDNFGEAEQIARKMLRLNPPDNQGARFLIEMIQKREPWREE